MCLRKHLLYDTEQTTLETQLRWSSPKVNTEIRCCRVCVGRRGGRGRGRGREILVCTRKVKQTVLFYWDEGYTITRGCKRQSLRACRESLYRLTGMTRCSKRSISSRTSKDNIIVICIVHSTYDTFCSLRSVRVKHFNCHSTFFFFSVRVAQFVLWLAVSVLIWIMVSDVPMDARVTAAGIPKVDRMHDNYINWFRT